MDTDFRVKDLSQKLYYTFVFAVVSTSQSQELAIQTGHVYHIQGIYIKNGHLLQIQGIYIKNGH